MIQRIFAALDRRYLVRAYLIGLVLTILMFVPIVSNPDMSKVPLGLPILLIVNLVLFPFAKFTWDSSLEFIMGNTVIYSNVIFHFMSKFIVNLILLAFAWLVAPLGIAWLWFRSR